MLQFHNAAMIVDRGMGTILDFENISEETVDDAIHFALQPKIKENAQRVSYSYKHRQQRPLKKAIWWIEHVAATGGSHLTKSHSTLMSWYEYHSLDVLLVLAVAVTLLVAVFICAIKSLCGRIERMLKEKTE